MPFIASGSYGCVFKPHLKCENKQPKSKNTIGKIFYTEEDFEYERDVNEIVRNIDPLNKFTVLYLGECETNSSYSKEDRVDQCQEFDVTGRPVNQLIYAYGGLSLMDYISINPGNIKDFTRIFKGLLNILEGLSKLESHGYVHQDIKPDNILIGSGVNSLKSNKMYIIDFGLLDAKDRVFIPSNFDMLKYNYPYFPPEYKMYIYKNDFNKFYKEYTNNFYFGFVINGKREFLFDKFGEIGITDTVIRDAYKSTKLNDIIKSPAKTDLYSFGIVVLMILIWSKMLPFSSALSDEVKKYVFNIIQPCPSKRYSFAQAIQHHKKIIQKYP